MMSNLWDRRYKSEEMIWGNDASSTARLLIQYIGAKQNIIDIGCGYARDTKYLLDLAHTLTGVDVSAEGLRIAAQKTQSYLDQGDVCFVNGNFSKIPLLRSSFDAATSHRVLHLVPNNHVEGFTQKIAELVKAGGHISISARDPRDFKEDQMQWISNDNNDPIAEYKTPGRAGHIISFWDETRFTKSFSYYFNILEFQQNTEPEATCNPVPSYYTTMIAQRNDRHPLEIAA